MVTGVLAAGLFAVVGPADAVFPGFNGKIAFVSQRDGNQEIYTVNPDGSGLARLTNNPAFDNSPQWSPDGSRIAFQSNRDGNSNIYVMNADGSGVTKVTTSEQGGGSGPSWSPDGQRLAYSADPGEVLVLTLATGAALRLTTDSCTRFQGGVLNPDCAVNTRSHGPTWSPDGALIAYRKVQGTSSSVWVMNPDGSNQHDLTPGASHANYIDWSPDGRQLAYSDHSQSVQILNQDGSNVRVVPGTRVCPSSGNCFVLNNPGWSPDGAKLVAATAIAAIPAPGLYVFGPDGSGMSRILADGSQGLGQPSWQARRLPPLPPQASAAVCTQLQAIQTPLLQPILSAGSIARLQPWHYKQLDNDQYQHDDHEHRRTAEW